MMKVLKFITFLSLFVAGCGVSYNLGYNKNYEVACRMSDLIRCYEDHLNEDSLIEDYNCFEDLEDIFLYDDAVGPIIDLDNYVYCY